jgi:LacI family transcriptional regulator
MSIARVAKRAGVSTATVSRVLNRIPGVSPKTSEQVWSAVEELKFDVLGSKRGPAIGSTRSPLVRPRTEIIAAITVGHGRDVLRFPVINAVLEGVQRAAKGRGLRLMIDEIFDPSNPGDLITRRQVDGVVAFILGDAPISGLTRIAECLPLVWVMGAHSGPLEVDHVAPDGAAVGHLAFNYLHSQRCEHIAFVARNPGWRFVRQRSVGFIAAATEKHVAVSQFLVTGDPLLAESYGNRVIAAPTNETLADAIASACPRPTGLFIETDREAAAIYPLLAQRGMQPGKDVKIISCDNERVILSAMHPQPMSIDLRPDEIGRHAVDRLVHRMDDRYASPIRIQVPPQLAEVGL